MTDVILQTKKSLHPGKKFFAILTTTLKINLLHGTSAETTDWWKQELGTGIFPSTRKKIGTRKIGKQKMKIIICFKS